MDVADSPAETDLVVMSGSTAKKSTPAPTQLFSRATFFSVVRMIL